MQWGEESKYSNMDWTWLSTPWNPAILPSQNSSTIPCRQETSSITKPLGLSSRRRLRQPLIAAAPGLICARSLTQMTTATQMHFPCNTLHQKSYSNESRRLFGHKEKWSNQEEYTSSTPTAKNTLGSQATQGTGCTQAALFACSAWKTPDMGFPSPPSRSRGIPWEVWVIDKKQPPLKKHGRSVVCLYSYLVCIVLQWMSWPGNLIGIMVATTGVAPNLLVRGGDIAVEMKDSVNRWRNVCKATANCHKLTNTLVHWNTSVICNCDWDMKGFLKCYLWHFLD